MICPKCGQTIDDGVKFCPICGENLAAYAAAPQQPAEENKPAFCAGCGAPMEPGLKFCPKCGTPAGTAQKPKAKAKIDKKWFIIGGCALAAIVVAVVLIVVLTGGVGRNGASSAEAIGEAYFDAMMDGDAEAYFGLICTPILRRMSNMSSSATRDEMIDYLAERGKNIFDDMDGMASVDLQDVTVVENNLTDSIYLSYFTEEERASVQDIAKVKLTVRYSVMGYSDTDTETVYCVKMDGKWFLLHD